MKDIAITGQMRNIGFVAVLSVVLVTLFVYFNPGYIQTNVFFVIAALTLPISTRVSGARGGYRYLLLFLFFAAFSLHFTTSFGVLLALLTGLLFVFERTVGRLGLLAFIHLILLSPLFLLLTSMISFPIRLQLTNLAVKILLVMHPDIHASGNMISLQGNDFLVDEACAGLYMIEYAVLFGTLIMSFLLRAKKEPSVFLLIGNYALLFALSVGANLIRIVILVQFRIMPDNWLHEAIGLVTFGACILLPFYIFIKWIASKRNADAVVNESNRPSRWFQAISASALMLIVATLSHMNANRDKFISQMEVRQMPDTFLHESLKFGVEKYYNDEAIIYIKPPVPAYMADHNPTICWRGGGYKMSRLRKRIMNGVELWQAELDIKDTRLYTVWWYESDACKTGSQWEWRTRSVLNGEAFSLVNVTCADSASLERYASRLLSEEDFVASQ